MQEKPAYVFQSRDGEQIVVYHTDQTQEAALRDLLERATPEHRLTTSHEPGVATPGVVAAELLRGDSWVAVGRDATGEAVPLALARYVQTGDDEAEITVVVRDDMQTRGIGSRLLYFLLDQVRAAGIRKARTSFDNSNEAAWQVLQYSPYHITWQPRDRQVDVVIHLQARASAGTTMN